MTDVEVAAIAKRADVALRELVQEARGAAYDERVRAFGRIYTRVKPRSLRRGFVEVPAELWLALEDAVRRYDLTHEEDR